MARCKSCGAPIIWATTEKGKAMPLDETPTEGGNVGIRSGDRPGNMIAVVNPGPNDVVSSWRFTSHFATCPNAAKHRKERGK